MAKVPSRRGSAAFRSSALLPALRPRNLVREPLQTGIKSIRFNDPHGRGTARVDHSATVRRAKHRHHSGHDFESEGRRRNLHLLRDRAKALDHRAGRESTDRRGRDGLHHRSLRHRDRAPPHLQYIAPYAACAMGEFFRDSGRHAVSVFTTIFQARAGVPENFAAVAASARPRSVSGRLFSISTRVCWSAPRSSTKIGRRFAHGAAGNRNASGRRLGLHSTNVISLRRADLSRKPTFQTAASRPAINVGLLE